MPSSARPRLVVVGASAGGIEALARVLAELPPNFPAPIVIAQHIYPRRPSLLGDILGRSSILPVRTITEDQTLMPGTVFVVPANRHVEIRDHQLSLWPADLPGPMPSVDRLLKTAAVTFGPGLVAVILSGTGSDGAAGARVVKEYGGTVIVENPETAKFSGMPQALDAATVDVVADLDRIAPVLQDLIVGRHDTSGPQAEPALERFLERVRSRSGINFGSYKRPTIRRRLQRRMVATNSRTIEEYVAYLDDNPEEHQRLVDSLLIKVTEFFRDADVFAYLREQVLPDIVSRARGHGGEIRLWSAGCATGEEAYSLAIALCEVLGDELDRFHVRVFATDVAADVVAFARRGIYPASALAHVAPDLVARYFTEDQDGFAINQRVRNLIVFGEHDICQRPPFPHIDLLICRNVLIYFTGELQQRALQSFAFSVRDEGYLVLGKAETASLLSDFLQLEQPALKVYRRRGGPMLMLPMTFQDARQVLQGRQSRRLIPGDRRMGRPAPQARPGRAAADRLNELFLHLPVGVVVVSARYDVHHINHTARRMLGINGGGVGEDLVHAASSAPPGVLKRLIDSTFRDRAPHRAEEVGLDEAASGEVHHVDIVCYPSPGDGEPGQDLVALVLHDITSAVNRRRQLDRDLADARREREQLGSGTQRLGESNRELREANDKLAAQNIELQTANAEFLENNEEVQAAGEEVETLNEELQATNEELETMNEELQSTVEELHASNDDLQARSVELQEMVVSRERQRQEIADAKERLEVVLASMGSAVLVVDGRGRPVLANEAYERRFGAFSEAFRVEDLDGTPLPPDCQPQRRAAQGESFAMEFVVVDGDGTRHWFDAIGTPLRLKAGGDGQPFSGGGVVCIRDVSDRTLRRLQDEFLAIVSHELRTPLTAVGLYAGMLARIVGGGPADGRLRRIAESLAVETRRMDLLVNDLMDVGRLQSGRVSLHREDVDLVQVLRRVADLGQHMTRGQVIHLHVPDAEVWVNGDAHRLEQVMMNLLENAIVYAVDTERIDVRLSVAADQAEVQVQDYGPGIPAASLPHLFSRFYRVSRHNSVTHGGLGLGLYIVQQLILAHGGDIDVQSVEGEGTIFTIHLPLNG